jgi:arginase
MHIALIAVPYDSGRRGERMGAGPLRLLASGLGTRLEEAGHHVMVQTLELPAGTWPAEIAAAFQLAAGVSQAVAGAIAAGAFPLVLSGNCGPAALGCVAALQGRTHVFWFDAHGDFNTPETTTTGFLDGMALAAVTGRCWPTMTRDIPGFAAVPETNVTGIGMRDLDEDEAAALHASSVRRVRVAALRPELSAILSGPAAASATAYLHLDLDVLDPREGRMNSYATPDGVTLADLQWAIAAIVGGTSVRAASITAFDPATDTGARAHESAVTVAMSLAATVAARATREES